MNGAMVDAASNANDLASIAEKYDAGQLEPIRSDLEHFLRAKKRDILGYFDALRRTNPRLALDVAVKLYLLKMRTINPKRDIQEQLDEIKSYTQSQMLRRPSDLQDVTMEWVRMVSPQWRAQRVTTIVYVFDREKERFLKVFVEHDAAY